MDAVTHVLAGYVLGLGLFWRHRRRGALATVTAGAALAPDLDVLLSPLARIDVLYWMGHRGVTHSLLGAPLAAWALVALLGRMAGRWPRLDAFGPGPLRWAAILAGAWSELLLDGITHHGVPWAWPFSDARWALEWYYWMIWWLAPLSFVPLWKRFRGTWDDRRLLQAAAVIAVVVLVVGGIRLAGRPDPEDGDVFSRRSPFEWTVVRQHDNGSFEATHLREGRVLDQAWYAHTVPPDAAFAVAAARASLAYRAFAFEGFGHYAFRAEPAGEGWNVTVLDVVERFELRDRPSWLPAAWLEDQGRMRLHVAEGGVRVVDRGR